LQNEKAPKNNLKTSEKLPKACGVDLSRVAAHKVVEKNRFLDMVKVYSNPVNDVLK